MNIFLVVKAAFVLAHLTHMAKDEKRKCVNIKVIHTETTPV